MRYAATFTETRPTGPMADPNGRINQVRALLRELGFAIPVGARHVVGAAAALLREGRLPEPLRPVLQEASREIVEFNRRIKEVEQQLRAVAAQVPVVKRLESVPGVGLLSSTALIAFVGDVQRFPSGRHFASYLGLTPRERSSGLRRRLGSINKAGDVYLRTLLISGARSVLIAAQRVKHEPSDRLRNWALQVHRLRGQNRAAMAVANKLSRIVCLGGLAKRHVVRVSCSAHVTTSQSREGGFPAMNLLGEGSADGTIG